MCCCTKQNGRSAVVCRKKKSCRTEKEPWIAQKVWKNFSGVVYGVWAWTLSLFSFSFLCLTVTLLSGLTTLKLSHQRNRPFVHRTSEIISAAFPTNPSEWSHWVWSRNGRGGCSDMLSDVNTQAVYWFMVVFFKNCSLTKARRKDVEKVWIFRRYYTIKRQTWSKLSVGTLIVYLPTTCFTSAFWWYSNAEIFRLFLHLFVLLWSMNNFCTSMCESRIVGRSLGHSFFFLFRFLKLSPPIWRPSVSARRRKRRKRNGKRGTRNRRYSPSVWLCHGLEPVPLIFRIALNSFRIYFI